MPVTEPWTISGKPLGPGRAVGRLHRKRRAEPAILLLDSATDLRVAGSDWAAVVVVGDRPNPRAADRPGVGSIPADLLLEGDRVTVDGDRGVVEVEGVEVVDVVTAFLVDRTGRVLLLRRSESVGSFQGRWSAVSGYLEAPNPIDQALTEVAEETGIASGHLTMGQEGAVVCARDARRVYRVHPFRFTVGETAVRLDWENVESRWAAPDAMRTLATVPKLWECFEAASHGRPVGFGSKP